MQAGNFTFVQKQGCKDVFESSLGKNKELILLRSVEQQGTGHRDRARIRVWSVAVANKKTGQILQGPWRARTVLDAVKAYEGSLS
jgi:hypothetical protein